jgi:transcriptional activator SPT7
MEEPEKFEAVTLQSVPNQIGLVQEWLLTKLHDNGDEALVEDDELPVKQRFPKPRLPPTGKISSPRKRPLREQQQMARKKRKLDEEKEDNGGNDNSTNGNGSSNSKGILKPIGKLKLDMPSQKENQNVAEPEKDDGSAVGMISPESILAA